MELTPSEKSHPKLPIYGKRNIAPLFVSAFLVLFIIVLIIFLRRGFNQSTIYKGVLVEGRDMAGYSRDELYTYLDSHYKNRFDRLALTITSQDFEKIVTVSDLGITIDKDAMVQKAYETGRLGNILQRLFKILRLRIKNETIEMILNWQTEEFAYCLDQTYEEVYREIIPANIVILEDRVMLTTGLPGQEADKELLKDNILSAIQTLKSAKISVPLIEKALPNTDVETLSDILNSEPIDAEFIKTSRTTYEIKPHQMGRRIDKNKLIGIVNYIDNRENKEYEELILPVDFISPSLTKDSLVERLFRDVLASYTTHFKTNNVNNINRGINIRLAAESIHGTILSSGEKFSFNEIVGARTSKRGYKTAHIFVAGEIRDGAGGGVCQVSTTLYNAVLRSNLEVLERHNHMFTVGYVPLGMDAAVSYGYADLVFENTTDHPLLINCRVTDNNALTFTILSTNDYPNINVKLATQTISTTPPTIKYINDPTRPINTAIISDKGSTGYVVDTYMKILNGDILIREEKLHRSIYQMIPKKIIRGTAMDY